MSRILECNLLFPGCDAEVRGETDEEILTQAEEHVRTTHDMEEVDEQTRSSMMAAVRQF